MVLESLIEPLKVVTISIFLYMTLWYLGSLLLKDSSIADVAWGIGFIFIAFITLFWNQATFTEYLVTALVTLWGLRLSTYIIIRNRGKEEDFRYKKWREEWNYFYIRSYFQVFLFQGFLMLIFSLPVIFINLYSQSFHWFALVGTLIWLVGFYFESVGDYQKYQFKQENEGLMTDGLWSLTRHPNYFGESTMWWGIWIIAATAPNGWMTIISPILLTYFLLKVSGVPLVEERYEGNPEWEEYKEETNKFIPWK